MGDVIQVSQGVTKKIIRQGNGPTPTKGAQITVHCTGSLTNPPKKFWSTKDAGQQPFSFKVGLGQVITGWDEGCITMRVGEIAKFDVCSAKALGKKGFIAWGVVPNSDLQFEIELLAIKEPPSRNSDVFIAHETEKNLRESLESLNGIVLSDKVKEVDEGTCYSNRDSVKKGRSGWEEAPPGENEVVVRPQVADQVQVRWGDDQQEKNDTQTESAKQDDADFTTNGGTHVEQPDMERKVDPKMQSVSNYVES